jgi:hypothetical protein
LFETEGTGTKAVEDYRNTRNPKPLKQTVWDFFLSPTEIPNRTSEGKSNEPFTTRVMTSQLELGAQH